MKKHIRSLALATACGTALLSPTLGWSQNQERGWYLNAGAGAAITPDVELKEFFGPVAPGSKLKFDTGIRADFVGGYQFNDWFALEANTGILANRVRSVTGASRLDDAWLSNVPLLFNVRFQGPKQSWVSPFIGAGVGATISTFEADHLDIGGTSLHGSQSDGVLAYQAFAGLRFRINQRMGLSLAYHYFGTGEPEWQADFASGTTTDRMKLGRVQTHSISAVFDFTF